MKVLVVGSGGREHALALALAESGVEVTVSPGSRGMQAAPSRPFRAADGAPSVPFRVVGGPPEEVPADLVVVGPEAPLADGLADRLRARGRRVLGPGADGARLESSKAWAKELMGDCGVPTASFRRFNQVEPALDYLAATGGPYVVKADGLAQGKGVLVTSSREEAAADVREKLAGRRVGDAGRVVLIEEALEGPELSVLALCDGERLVCLPPARDAKRLADGDRGPNTGGMGAFAPAAPTAVLEEVRERILAPTVAGLRRRGIDYRGVLYAGVMLTADGPKVIEYNVRFGDPEAQVVLPIVGADWADLLAAAAAGRLAEGDLAAESAAVAVVVAAAGYPEAPRRGEPISGVAAAEASDPRVRVLQAGTDTGADGRLVADGGRVLDVVARADHLPEARWLAYRAVDLVEMRGAQFRRDIAAMESGPAAGFPEVVGPSGRRSGLGSTEAM